MLKLEQIKVNSRIRGIAPTGVVTIKHVQMFGEQALELTFVDAEGKPGTQLVLRSTVTNWARSRSITKAAAASNPRAPIRNPMRPG